MPTDPKQRYLANALRSVFGMARLLGLHLDEIVEVTNQEVVKLRDDFVDEHNQEQG